jgi:hypothetical protein
VAASRFDFSSGTEDVNREQARLEWGSDEDMVQFNKFHIGEEQSCDRFTHLGMVPMRRVASGSTGAFVRGNLLKRKEGGAVSHCEH